MKLFKTFLKNINPTKQAPDIKLNNPESKFTKVNNTFEQFQKVEKNPFAEDTNNSKKYFRSLIDDALAPEDIFKCIKKRTSITSLGEQLEKDKNRYY